MCGQCKTGPITHYGCADLQSHHNEQVQNVRVAGRAGQVNNACPSCGWFSPKIQDWPVWDGVLRMGTPTNTLSEAAVSFDLWLCAGMLGSSPDAEVNLLRAVAGSYSRLITSILAEQGTQVNSPEREKLVEVLRCWSSQKGAKAIAQRLQDMGVREVTSRLGYSPGEIVPDHFHQFFDYSFSCTFGPGELVAVEIDKGTGRCIFATFLYEREVVALQHPLEQPALRNPLQPRRSVGATMCGPIQNPGTKSNSATCKSTRSRGRRHQS